jgi:D-glycero-beta-D-manno-heptose 1-phosphate adenylyltransferase
MQDHWSITKSKIVSLEMVMALVKVWKQNDEKIVFTNGCFDILHLGHVTYLAKAASLGNHLIVALNSDDSVRLLNKAPNRPIHDENARQCVVAGLGFVDAVLLFHDTTPLSMIEAILPDVLVKGADYDAKESDKSSIKYIVGSDIVLKNGGSVETIDLVIGHSTTGILAK